MKTFEELEAVTLKHDIPEHSLPAGSIGTIVHIHRDGTTYDVEFVDDAGETVAMPILDADRLDKWSASSEAAE